MILYEYQIISVDSFLICYFKLTPNSREKSLLLGSYKYRLFYSLLCV